jgi:uncharacterized repeat protein (TIGR01451 family)
LSGFILKIPIVAALLLCTSLHGIAAVVISPSVLPNTPAGDLHKKTEPLSIVLTVKKIVLQHGKEQLVDANNAVPGDVLEYRVEYKNTGATALSEILATLPLPIPHRQRRNGRRFFHSTKKHGGLPWRCRKWPVAAPRMYL